MADVVTVALGAPGRHLFERLRDTRIRLIPLDEGAEPDVIVFPCGRHRRFEHLDNLTLPCRLAARIADGCVRLIFDASLEGVPHKPDITDRLHRVVQRFGAPFDRCVYLTQDRQYADDYRTHCQALALPSVSVLTYDYWVWEALDAYADTGEEVYEARLRAFRKRSSPRRRFLTLNRTPRPAKILLLLRLLRDGLWDQGFVSFGGFQQKAHKPGKPRPSLDRLREALPGFEDLVEDLAPHLGALDGYGRVLLGMDRHGWSTLDLDRAKLPADLAEYDASWFSIVAETEMRPRPSRITEKVVKPLVNFHPMLVLGNPGALAMIRGYGFQTFGGWCDESYDEELDPRRRFELVYGEIRRLCALDDRTLARLERRLEETLTFNARWGLTRVPTIYRAEQDARLVSAILTGTAIARPLSNATF